MKIGVFLQAQWDLNDPETDIEAGIAGLVRQAELAEALNYESVWLPQHYVSAPYASIQPTPLMGLLAAHTKRVRIGTGVYLVPFTSPMVLAEEMSSVDWITGGRLIFGAGMGYRSDEFAAMGVPFPERVGRFVEGLDLLRKLWTGDSVTHTGKYFSLDNVTISLKPKQPGGPPIWIGGGVAAAVRRAARIGDAWVSSMNPSFEELRDLLSEFDAARTDQPPANARPSMRECYITGAGGNAFDDVRDILYAKYSAYQSWGISSSQTKVGGRDDFDAFMKSKFLVGTEAEVMERMRWMRDELGVDHLIARVRWPGLSEEQALETMRRLSNINGRM
ncbi:MAG: LLM class flavin-dependent oxidoreductase [Rhodospirillaceae bacterium]|jgi:alkanesulfonate monooxygenase SsuD/methylene tetrahydromethanopterin reductase-like flavin-dependent oxidoreductase (luciferase family)|nr:LLM class flavin-dependent oxidoreductase [Rhodospirillaceae bacterium]MBT5667665.1 LLM class flavin-dependent oxidoreductase [Rhodospirillaceae bacterium]MBT5809475.1 LLM class flavin-dependent oxidoreductase [Rhodospirillaceae bacterium]